MFIDIFDTIKKHTIHVIITILLFAIYAGVSNNAVDDSLYRFLLGAFSYVVVCVCSYGLFSCLRYFVRPTFYGSESDTGWHVFIMFRKALPIFLLAVTSILVYGTSDFSSINNIQELIKITIVIIIVCSILYILSMIVVYFLNRWLLQKNYFRHQSDNNESDLILPLGIFVIGIIIVFVSVFSWHLLFVSLTSSPQFQGNIDSDMQNKYHMGDSPIHTLIRATGPDTGLSVEFKSESSDRYYDALIYLDKNNESMSNKSLNGKFIGKGEYSIYINTTGMPVGYYNLRCTRQKYVESYSLKRLYLEND